MKKIVPDKKIMEKNIVKEVTFIEKELLLNSLTQQELLKTTKGLDATLKELTNTLKILEKHEYLELHRSKWKLVGYNILLGVLFAVGTVLGLVLLSWFTFNFFKDSAILNQIIRNQLEIRQFNIGDIKERAISNVGTQTQSGENTGSGK